MKRLIRNEVARCKPASLRKKLFHISSFMYFTFIFQERITVTSFEEAFKGFMVKPQTSDIRMTYEYIRVTYGSHTSDIRITYEWHTDHIRGTYKWHADDVRVHTSDIRMTYEWHTDQIRVTYGPNTSAIQVHMNDIRMTCKLMLNCISLFVSLNRK